jgi:hypothetical protein
VIKREPQDSRSEGLDTPEPLETETVQQVPSWEGYSIILDE